MINFAFATGAINGFHPDLGMLPKKWAWTLQLGTEVRVPLISTDDEAATTQRGMTLDYFSSTLSTPLHMGWVACNRSSWIP